MRNYIVSIVMAACVSVGVTTFFRGMGVAVGRTSWVRVGSGRVLPVTWMWPMMVCVLGLWLWCSRHTGDLGIYRCRKTFR